MSKILRSRTLLGVGAKADLKELKTAYRNLMKEFHPDKFQQGDEQAAAEEKSKKMIEAYHFLVSIAPETHAANFEEYNNVISNSMIVDFNYKGTTLQITYAEGNSYEYLDVPKATYVKLVNSDIPNRFARRHICGSFVYREVSKATAAA